MIRHRLPHCCFHQHGCPLHQQCARLSGRNSCTWSCWFGCLCETGYFQLPCCLFLFFSVFSSSVLSADLETWRKVPCLVRLFPSSVFTSYSDPSPVLVLLLYITVPWVSQTPLGDRILTLSPSWKLSHENLPFFKANLNWLLILLSNDSLISFSFANWLGNRPFTGRLKNISIGEARHPILLM